MTLHQLVEIADRGYRRDFPESGLIPFCHADGTPLSREEYARAGGGDALAFFVAHELYETYDEAASEYEQLATAARAVRKAAEDLLNVAQELLDHVEIPQ